MVNLHVSVTEFLQLTLECKTHIGPGKLPATLRTQQGTLRCGKPGIFRTVFLGASRWGGDVDSDTLFASRHCGRRGVSRARTLQKVVRNGALVRFEVDGEL
jgi:hypothetical protein